MQDSDLSEFASESIFSFPHLKEFLSCPIRVLCRAGLNRQNEFSCWTHEKPFELSERERLRNASDTRLFLSHPDRGVRRRDFVSGCRRSALRWKLLRTRLWLWIRLQLSDFDDGIRIQSSHSGLLRLSILNRLRGRTLRLRRLRGEFRLWFRLWYRLWVVWSFPPSPRRRVLRVSLRLSKLLPDRIFRSLRPSSTCCAVIRMSATFLHLRLRHRRLCTSFTDLHRGHCHLLHSRRQHLCRRQLQFVPHRNRLQHLNARIRHLHARVESIGHADSGSHTNARNESPATQGTRNGSRSRS